MSWPVLAVALTMTFVPPDGAADVGAQPDEKANRFTIVRDPKLGKPLVSWRTPPKDAEGRQAVDVMEQFLTHVRDDEIEKAKALCQFMVWTSKSAGSIGEVTADDLLSDPECARRAKAQLAASEALSPEFVRQLQQATKYTLGATVKQKGKYWNMRIVAEGVKEQPWPYAVCFSYKDGTWTILIDNLVWRYREREPNGLNNAMKRSVEDSPCFATTEETLKQIRSFFSSNTN